MGWEPDPIKISFVSCVLTLIFLFAKNWYAYWVLTLEYVKDFYTKDKFLLNLMSRKIFLESRWP